MQEKYRLVSAVNHTRLGRGRRTVSFWDDSLYIQQPVTGPKPFGEAIVPELNHSHITLLSSNEWKKILTKPSYEKNWEWIQASLRQIKN